MKKYRILKLLGLVILTIIVLVLISFIEVAVYSYLINPGQDISVYDAHAMESAPWISCIFGFLVFFLVVRYWGKKKYDDLLKLTVFFALTYITIDLIIMVIAISMGEDWTKIYPMFLVANGAKFFGGLAAYYIYKPKTERSYTIT